MATVAQLNVEIGARIAELQKGLKSASRELANAGKEFGTAGKKAGQNFSDGLVEGVKQAGPTLAQVGSSLTQALTIPLGLLGGAAIHAAGEFESLKLAMVATFGNANRSAEEAKSEVEALRKAALAPGLDFPQAVAASIRLQSVGLSAEKARNVIIELANAVASTGGTAQNLESVTVQMSQMISKGKVLSQDLRIIQENLPIISSLMLKAFGTSNADQIQKLGITGKQFVEGITKEMTKLNRVEGGISNAIVNAGSAIKQFLASIGDELNKVFNIGDKSDQFAAALQNLSTWFKELSASTKRTAIEVALALTALGPLLKAFSFIGAVSGQVAGVFLATANTVKSLTGAFGAMEGALSRVKLAFGVIGIVTALAVAVYELSDNFDAAEFASNKFVDAQSEIVSQTSKEIGTVNELFAAVKDQTKSNFERGQSVDKLLKLYPEYFRGMDIEHASISKLTELQDGLNASILRGVAERQKAQAVAAIYEKQAAILLRIQQLREGSAVTVSESTLINTGDLVAAGWDRARAVIEKLQAQSDSLGSQVGVVSGQFDRAFGTMSAAIDPVLKKEYDLRDAYEVEHDAHIQGIAVTKADTQARVVNKDAIDEQKKKLKTLKDVIGDVSRAVEKAKLLGDDEDIAKLEALRKGIERLIDVGFSPASAAVQDLKKQLDLLTEKPHDILIDVITVNKPSSPTSENPGSAPLPNAPNPGHKPKPIEKKRIDYNDPTVSKQDKEEQLKGDYKETYKKIALEAEQAAFEIFNNLADQRKDKLLANLEEEGRARLAAAKGNAKLEASIQADLDKKRAQIERKAAIRKKVAALAEAAINTAVAITKASSSAPFPFNLPAIIQAAALGAIQLGVIASQKFASGTRDAPGGLSLVGERGPEFVNLPRHSQVFNAGVTSTALRGGGQNMNISGEFKIQGTDLVLVLERTQNKLAKFR
jgi:tape measure domain-containing protein